MWIAVCPATPYSTDFWPTDSGRAAVRPAEVAALEEYLFTLTGKSSERKGIRTNALLITQGGKVVYERYARGFGPDMPHLSWSIAKSVTSALVGVAVLRSGLNIDAPVTATGITVRHLLESSSGLRWQEIYENQANQASSTLALLYGEGRSDRAAFVQARAKAAEPGELYKYSTGSTVLLIRQAQNAMGSDHTWPWTYLFDPIGMRSAVFERDAKGTFTGGSHFYATPRDYAKLGALYLQDGCYNRERLLPEGWVAQSLALSSAFERSADNNASGAQGWQWWTNQKRTSDERLPWPNLPEDTYRGSGHWGQALVVIPSLDMIIVRTADDRERMAEDFDDRFMALAVAVGRP